LTEQPQTPSDQTPKRSLPLESGEPPVPAFGCIVYYSTDGGCVRGRVANLDGIEVTASSQRELLGQIVAQFKAVVAKSLAEGGEPEWVDPPAAKRDGEQKLFLPVHL
jgi:hypothetical protein